ncbi:MAG: glycosyltransferase, partial [Bacteroidota bacterium]
MYQYRSAYIAFDPYPSFKGSATHIHEVHQSMQEHFGDCLLLTLAGVETPIAGQLTQEVTASNYLKRGLSFSEWASKALSGQPQLNLIQFRDIWGGMAAIEQGIPTIFEVNGLPSIELKQRYSLIANSTLEKIAAIENMCLQRAEQIICPSAVIEQHLVNRGIDHKKIHVVPNSAHIPDLHPRDSVFEFPYVLYFGALQPWQGVKTAIKSLKYLEDLKALKLVICSSHKAKHARPYQKLIDKLGLNDQVVWRYQLPREQLYGIIHHAVASLAPLTECHRNLVQGCSPLKIFESMACQTAIIASDLPVTREILQNGESAHLIRPDRPAL